MAFLLIVGSISSEVIAIAVSFSLYILKTSGIKIAVSFSLAAIFSIFIKSTSFGEFSSVESSK